VSYIIYICIIFNKQTKPKKQTHLFTRICFFKKIHLISSIVVDLHHLQTRNEKKKRFVVVVSYKNRERGDRTHFKKPNRACKASSNALNLFRSSSSFFFFIGDLYFCDSARRSSMESSESIYT